MRLYKYKEIRGVMEAKGYKFFEQGVYNLNLIGVRSYNSQSDHFDDMYHIIFNPGDGMRHYAFPFTSDPGKHWLLNPLNKNGTAILIPNQYSGVYKLGIHGRSWASGGYPALEQNGLMEYVRDNDKDTKLNFDLYRDPYLRDKYAFRANIKSNTHRASQWKSVLKVGRYSAACQVIQSPTHYKTLMYLVKKAAGVWGNKFSYTLLEQQDFD